MPDPARPTRLSLSDKRTNMPTGPPARRSSTARRRYSTNSLEGQQGTLRTYNSTLQGDLRIRDRIHHFTLAWFTCTMSTGGIALVIARTPHRFAGLDEVGLIVFLFDLVLFVIFTALLTMRFVLFPKTFVSCLSHPTESLFLPTLFISVANLISNMQEYGAPHTGSWILVILRVMFWIYVACTFVVAVAQYFFLFTGKPFTIQSMTPAWLLPVFPVMLVGTLASALGGSQPPVHALSIAIAGITFQGLGMLIATFLYGPYITRLMTSGLPRPDMRPGMFIAVGPPSFTALALLGISSNLAHIYPSYSTISGVINPAIISDIFRVLAVSIAIFLWGTAFWFFCIALVSVVTGACTKPHMSFHLVWYALVFPNVGFTIATIGIGKALESEGILWIGSIMTILLVVTWIFVFSAHARAVMKKQILWPGKDEDHDQ